MTVVNLIYYIYMLNASIKYTYITFFLQKNQFLLLYINKLKIEAIHTVFHAKIINFTYNNTF